MRENDPDEMILFERCIVFLNGIGIKTFFTEIESDSFLPGLFIEEGNIFIDMDQLQHPGDILHEAGHIAVVPAADRRQLSEKDIILRQDREAEEIMAIAWSYAACMQLKIDPFFVFHDEGYREGSNYIVDSCKNNTYIGLRMLAGIGLTADEKSAKRFHIPTYPYLIRWLRN